PDGAVVEQRGRERERSGEDKSEEHGMPFARLPVEQEDHGEIGEQERQLRDEGSRPILRDERAQRGLVDRVQEVVIEKDQRAKEIWRAGRIVDGYGGKAPEPTWASGEAASSGRRRGIESGKPLIGALTPADVRREIAIVAVEGHQWQAKQRCPSQQRRAERA